ncbi:TVP38/TMEM64 family protein [Halonotius roseus]|uniref:TVP38/TMEM64 family protein n=1 Tax=Halonotius roseus TaxID=2511997 RepID=A0A544QRM3_9EURY|nr:TVP38/TMEM64 family protein [Halonotius roseus]TQQ82103.1 TVP38/TMEM64 family protein [Halonotius roseus]
MKVFSSRTDRWQTLLLVVAVIAAFVGLYVGARRYAPFVFNAQALRTWIAGFGIFAPLVFVFLQAAQVVLAPIPGQVVALVAGYLFGPVYGTIYSLTGVLIGSAIAFSLAKRYGRSFVERVIANDVIDRFDAFVERVGVPGLFAFVIIPGLPDDAICFLSGLTKWRLRTFLAVIAVGRLPAYVITVYAGGEFAGGRFRTGIALIAFVIVVSAVGYYKQEAVRDLVARIEPRLPF